MWETLPKRIKHCYSEQTKNNVGCWTRTNSNIEIFFKNGFSHQWELELNLGWDLAAIISPFGIRSEF